MLYGNEREIKMINYTKAAPKHIFKGIKGLGKARVAKALARHYLCKTKETNCTCSSCNKLKSGNHPDFRYVSLKEGEKSIKVSDVLPIVADTNTKPLESEYKVVIIDDADSMTEDAQNKLLKTVEELPEYMKIIFVAHGTLLPTINSRCLVHAFNPLDKGEMQAFLHTITDDALNIEFLSVLANGSPGAAKELLEGETVKYLSDTIDFLSSGTTYSEALDMIGLLKEKDARSIVAVLGDDLLYYLCGLKQVFFEATLAKFVSSEINLKSVIGKLKCISDACNTKKLYEILGDVDNCIEAFKNNKFSQEFLLFIVSKYFDE